MPTTSRGFWYPSLADNADVPEDMQTLAASINSMFLADVFANRPSSGYRLGREFYAIDTGDTWLDTGAGWVLKGSSNLVKGSDPRLPSQDENDALAGTNGAPSNTNRFVTNSDSRMSDQRTPAGHATTHGAGGPDELQAGSISYAMLVAPEAWRVVGAGGQPAFGSGWANVSDVGELGGFATGTASIAFYKFLGRVYLRGWAVRNSGTNDTIFTLPAGYRPGAPVRYAVGTSNQGVASDGTVEVQADGEVKILTSTTQPCSLDVINFRAEA